MGKHHKRKVIKKDGVEELFQVEKLCNSMVHVGADEDLANQVCQIVDASIESGESTDEIFKTTRKYLHDSDPHMAALYALERGLGALGPSGFIFEQYVAALFESNGWEVTSNVYAEGEGVVHEIDVWAEKGNVICIVEAKYRNDYHAKTHINQVMYADARLGDIRRQAQKNNDPREYYMWVVTNTRFTDAAINYVAHRDVQLMGWDYPKYINLKKIVYEKNLYPVTIIPSITKKALKVFSQEGIILVKQLAGITADDYKNKYNLSMTLSKKIEKEVKELL
ncbi:hypothetical protein CL684_00105 [Candidatus Campbellbacteria bacterium]|nr:hypothetical protein [Candidatus Campbellbacteria bacterium]|tara:strand:+ start:276 stop:1115 length:840 start_codon:yes stop_codon:yes gene_type:complete